MPTVSSHSRIRVDVARSRVGRSYPARFVIPNHDIRHATRWPAYNSPIMPSVEDIAVPLEALSDPTDLRELFPGDAPIELEIGSGKGGFLLRAAQAHPDRCYVGIEWANEYYRFTADRMARRRVSNVRVIRTDARHFVIHRLAPACLAGLHVYHPDPWPKKRHHKRRLFNAEFVDAAVRALQHGARWAIQTDHAEYFHVIRALTAARPDLVEVPFAASGDGEAEPPDDAAGPAAATPSRGAPATNFEIKYLREGRTIHRLAYRRVSS